METQVSWPSSNMWQILIDSLIGGFSPKYYAEGYPSYGNKSMGASMLNCDITNAGGIQQGPGLANLTNGTESGAVTTLIQSILDLAVTSDTTYGIGGNLLHKISSTAVTNSGGLFPHTIDKAAVTGETGEDVCYYQGNIYYSYNHSGSAGDIGKYDLVNTFTDAWGSTVPSGAAALTSNPHQMIVGSSDVMFFTNGRYVGKYDGSTYAPQQLPLPINSVASSIAWNAGQVFVTANIPSVSGTNKNHSSIYVWDGSSANWTTEVVLKGYADGLHVKNGVVYFFYRDVSNTGGFKLAYLSGTQVVDVCNFSGGLPKYYQVTDYKDFIIWNVTSLNSLWSQLTFPWQLTSPWTTTTGDDLIYAWGSGDINLPVRTFQLADSGYTTAGALAAPFGTPMIASTQSTSFKLAQFSGFDVNSNWKSLMFDVTGNNRYSSINRVKILYDQLATGARVDWVLRNSKGKVIAGDTISYSKVASGETTTMSLTQQITNMQAISENFRIEFDWSNGSTTNSVFIRGAKVFGDNQ